MGGNRESRRDYMNTRNKRYYKSPGRRFHRSNSRESRNSSRHRSSTPNNLKSPNRFDKTREVNSTVNERLEKIEKTLEKVSKQVENLCSFNSTINETGFISNLSEEREKEEHCVQELFWTKNEKKSILLDSGAPKSVAGIE